MTVVGKKGVHRPIRDQVAAPGGRVHLLIGGMTYRAHEPGSLPAPSSQRHHRIDPTSPIDRNDRTMPVQQAPSVDDLARSFELLPPARQATAAQSCAWKAVSTGVAAMLAAQLAMLV